MGLVHGRVMLCLGITFTGVSWRWKKVSSAWFAGAAFFCVWTSARCWFCLLSLVVCELLRDDVAWEVGTKRIFHGLFVKAIGTVMLKDQLHWATAGKEGRCGGACPLKAFQLGRCVQVRCLRSASLRKCGWCRVSPSVEVGLSGVWHLIWIAAQGKQLKATCSEFLILIRWLNPFLFSRAKWM